MGKGTLTLRRKVFRLAHCRNSYGSRNPVPHRGGMRAGTWAASARPNANIAYTLPHPLISQVVNMVKRAIISDIHGNLEALLSVLAHIAKQQVDEIFCLGDIVGYGPNPCECLDQVMDNCKTILLGNHDQGAMFDPEGFNSGAERAIFWTREQLENSGGPREAIDRRRDFLGTLPRLVREEPWLYVHGSARNPVNEYVFPEDIYNQKKMEKLFSLIEKGCCQGHTHVPGIFLESQEFITPDQTDYQFSIQGEKFMVNVGSVGQPRDGDPRSCYVIQEEDAITFHRVEYDIETTANKIYHTPDLDNFLGDRIKEGR
jgi:predicted phosphodiesterase